jgi:hypothetical protein
MEIKENYSFQVDSEIIKGVYNNHNNYLIEYSADVPKEYCIVYFSSNDLYFPNNESAFREHIIEKNRFELYGNRIKRGHKHIFIRDIQKQWYLGGINSSINNPVKLLEFLKEQTSGYKTITLGSSAGGYAAVVYGQQLNAEMIYSFNGQFELESLIKKSDEKKDPLIFRNIDNKNIKPWYDTTNFIVQPKSIFYFHSARSSWDIEQRQHVNNHAVITISFNSNNHGLPFYRFNLHSIINMSYDQLVELSKKDQSPFKLSKNLIGLVPTIKSYLRLSFNYITKLTVRKTKFYSSKLYNNK